MELISGLYKFLLPGHSVKGEWLRLQAQLWFMIHSLGTTVIVVPHIHSNKNVERERETAVRPHCCWRCWMTFPTLHILELV